METTRWIGLARTGLLAAPLLCFASCGGTGSDPHGAQVAVEDSAGITVITHPSGPFWDTVSSSPLLTVGQEGDPEYEFFGLRTVVPLASGNLVVVNGGTSELRFYDPDGHFLRSVGREGEGPAEFAFLSTVWHRPGDTLVAMDPQRRRIVFFDSAGALARGENFGPDMSAQPERISGGCFFPGIDGIMDGGIRVMRGWGCMDFKGSAGRRPVTQSMELAGPERHDTLTVLDVTWVWEREGQSDPRNQFGPIPFEVRSAYAIGPEHIYLTSGSAYEIQVYDRMGQMIRIMREEGVPPRVTEEDREAFRENMAQTGRPHPEDIPFPERFGGYQRLVLSVDGDLWAQRTPRPASGFQEWVVFSRDGRQLRRILVPDIQLDAVRDGRIYGHRSDTLGIQTVVVLNGEA